MLRVIRLWAVAVVATAMVFAVFDRSAAQIIQPAVRVFVSGQGADTGNCTIVAPCRSFAYAITKAGPGGEIVVLNSAGYGPVTITQSVTITNPGGVEAGVTATSGGNAITINNSAAATVTLRGLTLQGNGVGTNGINMISALPDVSATTNLNIIDCVVKDFTADGIFINPTSGTSPVLNVVIQNTAVLNNGQDGIQIAEESFVVITEMYQVTADENGTGIDDGGRVAVLVNSHADNNSTFGVLVEGGSTITMKSSTVNYNDPSAEADVGTGVTGANVYVYNDNTIGVLSLGLNSHGYTDGTNNIGTLIAIGGLTTLAPQ